jgi:hypothetical protein
MRRSEVGSYLVNSETYETRQATNRAIVSHPGSWVTAGRLIELPYDFETGGRPFPTDKPRSLATLRNVASAVHAPFTLPAKQIHVVHLIGAMGVVLGDSIVGLSAIHWLRETHPHLELVLYRPASGPDYVEQLYRLAKGARIVNDLRQLPWPVASIAEDAHVVDIGNFAYWPSFATTPMIDFFFRALGVDPKLVAPEAKANRWLNELALPELPQPWADDRPYVLFSPEASTPIRRIPARLHTAWVDRLWAAYGLPVLGFAPIEHPHYINIRALSPDTASFLSWIRGAYALVTADSAAVHAAAGFDVPTTAFFTTIDPAMRVREYPLCHAVDLRVDALRGMHTSDAPEHVELVEQAWQRADIDRMALPVDGARLASSPT